MRRIPLSIVSILIVATGVISCDTPRSQSPSAPSVSYGLEAPSGKLDELLRVHGEARNELTRLDEREPQDIEKWRARETKE